MKKKKLATCFLCLSLILNILLTVLLFAQNNTAIFSSAQAKNGEIVVTVLETNTLNPVDNATVCIIETKKYYQTNTKGLTEKISAPILKNQNFNNSLERPWGELTILVYKPGYADSINFYTAINQNTTRVGFVVYLTPIINEEDNTPTVNTETPNPSYITQLINLFKK